MVLIRMRALGQLGTLAGLEHGEDDVGDEGADELRQGGEEVQDAEVDAGQLAGRGREGHVAGVGFRVRQVELDGAVVRVVAERGEFERVGGVGKTVVGGDAVASARRGAGHGRVVADLVDFDAHEGE